MAYRTSLPPVPGIGARNGASALEAIQQAIGLYLKLKSQESDDKFKQQELDRQNKSADALSGYYKAQSGNLDADNSRADVESAARRFGQAADVYGGQRVDPTDPLVGLADKAGLKGVGFSPDMTLPAERLPGAMGGLPSGQPGTAPQMPPPVPDSGPQYFKPVPAEATGKLMLNQTEPSKMRMQEAAIAARGQQQGLNRDAANQRALATHNDKMAAMAQSAQFRAVAQELQAHGIRNADQMLQLALLRESNNDTMDEFNARLRAYMASAPKGNDMLSQLIGGAPTARPPLPTAPSLPHPVAPGAAPQAATPKPPSADDYIIRAHK